MKRFLILGIFLCVVLLGQTPQALADRFWNIVDNQLLPGGTLEQIIKAILAKNLPGSGTQASDTLIAQTPAVPDPFLTSADAKVRAMCLKRGIPYVEIPQTPTTPVPQNTTTLANRDPNLAVPAPAPAGFDATITPPTPTKPAN